MTVQAIYPVLITDRLAETRAFYADLLGLDAAFDSDWFSQLVSPALGNGQIGFVERGHDSIPDGPAESALVTIELDEVDAVYARALDLGVPIALELRDEDWGQRHFIARDPNGFLVDVVRVIPVTSPEAAASYAPGQLPEG